MLQKDCSKRISIKDILDDPWMNEKNIDKKEVKPKMKESYKKVLKIQATKE